MTKSRLVFWDPGYRGKDAGFTRGRFLSFMFSFLSGTHAFLISFGSWASQDLFRISITLCYSQVRRVFGFKLEAFSARRVGRGRRNFLVEEDQFLSEQAPGGKQANCFCMDIHVKGCS